MQASQPNILLLFFRAARLPQRKVRPESSATGSVDEAPNAHIHHEP
jgi:hypothetical protein